MERFLVTEEAAGSNPVDPVDMNLFSSIAGWVGAALVVSAYFLVSSKRVRGDNLIYQLMNIFGAIGVAINSYFQQAYRSVGIQVVWLAIGFFAIIQILKSKRNAKILADSSSNTNQPQK